jgi:MFS family permease
MVAAIVPIDLSVSWGASGFSPVAGDFAKDMDVSPSVAILGLSMYVLGLAFGPMTLAPLSEYFGRRPVYIVSYGVFLLLLLGTTYVESLGPFLVLRLFSGFFASTTISNFGGTIADLFHHHDTGPAMSWFLWAATGGSPTGFVLFSFIAHGRSWHAVFRIMFFICFTLWIIMVVALYALGETRHSVILLRRARALRKATGDENLEVPDEMKQRGPKQLFGIALARPFKFLGFEAIVQFGALYNGFLYGLSFLFNGAFHMIFGPNGYGYSTIGVGISFLGIVAGITLGLVTNTFRNGTISDELLRPDITTSRKRECTTLSWRLSCSQYPSWRLLLRPRLTYILFSQCWPARSGAGPFTHSVSTSIIFTHSRIPSMLMLIPFVSSLDSHVHRRRLQNLLSLRAGRHRVGPKLSWCWLPTGW